MIQLFPREAQYWLEMVDLKHRYGTNLKSYHEAWNTSSTKENFFYWLDKGEGKDLSLDVVRANSSKKSASHT